MDMLKITLCANPAEAPNYESPEYEAVTLESTVVVGKGTAAGNPTVDLILTNEQGQKYMALVKGSFLEEIAIAIRGLR